MYAYFALTPQQDTYWAQALTHALEEVGAVVPVYCCDVRQFGKASFGCEKAGRYRAELRRGRPRAVAESPSAAMQ
eukprot:contig_13152_g3126